MAVNESSQSAAGRRFFFGTNVLVMILLMAIIVVGINWIAHAKNWRRDVAGGFGGTQLSERTKTILAKAGPGLRITSVYTSDEPDNDRKKYLPKVEDLTQEIRQFNKQITVEHLYSGNERAELRSRVQKKFGSAATKYDEVINLAEGLWSELDSVLAPARKELEGFLRGDSWLGAYPTMANIAAVLRKDIENVEQTRKDVDELVKGDALPQYQEANNKIKSFNDDLKKHLEDTQKWMQEMQKLAQVLSNPANDFASTTRARLQDLDALLAELKKVSGDPNDPNVPEDPRPLLQDYAKAASRTATWLVQESGRIDTFIKANPVMQRHPKWLVRAQQGPFVTEIPLQMVLGESAQNLSEVSQRLRDFLKQDVPLDQLQNLVRQLRQVTAQTSEQLGAWNSGVTALFDEGARMKADTPEMKFLAKGAGGEMFKPVLDKLNDISTKIAALPALKLDEVARRLQQDNILVVETEKDVRVVTFDEMWPVADPQAFQYGGKEEEGQRRVFSGDGAIANAVLSMQVEKPFATVVLVGYEPQSSPQMRQFMRPPQAPIEMSQISKLREMLEGANFKIKEWNLAAEGAKKPDPEEGTQPVYVILPPAPKSQPNFMMGQQPNEKSFGEAELKQVKDALAGGAPAIFLTSWTPTGPFAPPAEYEYGSYLRDDWGIEVKPDYRIIRGVIDKQSPGKYGINLMQWYYMGVNGFTSQPVGEPLKSRRVLVRDVCPLTRAEKTPEGVKLAPILEVPSGANEFWADKDIGRIIKALRSPDGGSFSLIEGESMQPPFTIAMAAENDKTKGRIVVLGSGMSFRDDYLNQRVMRMEGKQTRLVTDPAPLENADLFVNAMFWLSGHQDLIAAGPAEVPVVPQIAARSQTSLWAIAFIWPLAVFVAGLGVWFVRRK